MNKLVSRRDSEISTAAEGMVQYITDHRDKEAFRRVDREVKALARAWDRMIDLLDKTSKKAAEIEASVENFYGD